MKDLDYKGDFIYVDSDIDLPIHLRLLFESENIYKIGPTAAELSKSRFYFKFSKYLSLFDNVMKKEIFFDLNKEYFLRSNKKGSLPFGPLGRAVGKDKDVHLIDATCGTGKDMILFLSMGVKKISAYERSPWVYPLLLDSTKNLFKEFPILEDSISLNFGMPGNISADIIYYDPMYPTKNKSALSRKEMEFFKTIIGSDSDSKEELERLRNFDVKRVIVKRPIKAKDLLNKPHFSVKGTTTRYDIYLKNK
ncbi:MAG: class I SAM-dependent methyltransferase [Halobacteriovoraceae bacterium]|nr:class I SAM-dependent methyltransferase [Halobacteriovoraceae bacterium]